MAEAPPVVPLTPEERKAIREAWLAEQKRLEELKILQLKHDYVSREVKYGQLTTRLHEKKWKQMLIDLSLPKLRADLEFTWHNFERVTDIKDFVISMLMDELRDAEEQYQRNFRFHAENIDNLMLRFRDLLEEMKKDNDSYVDFLKNRADEETDEVVQNAADGELYIRVMLFRLEMEKKDQEKLVRGDYLSKIDEEITKCNDALQRFRAGLENNYNKLWNETTTFLDNFFKQTNDRRKEYTSLIQQDQSLKKLCGEQKLKLLNMQDTIRKLKLRYGTLQEVEGQKIHDLIQERQYFADAFWTLRGRLIADKKLDADNLKILTTESTESAHHLKGIEKKGERLLELAAVCRKLETQEEKILPFPVPLNTTDLEKPLSDIKFDEYNNIVALQLFWQKVAQADATRHSINEEREYLKRENAILKSKIHHYCECLECHIPLITSKQLEPYGKHINITDGNSIMKMYRKQS